jgi:hypothetical protein
MASSDPDASAADGQSRKKKARKQPGERAVLDMLFAQPGTVITCPICGLPIAERGNIARDHDWSLGTGGPDIWANQRYVCKLCHDIKTRGAGATTAGTDVGVAAKMKRIARKREEELGLRKPKKKAKIKGGGFPSKEERAKIKARMEARDPLPKDKSGARRRAGQVGGFAQRKRGVFGSPSGVPGSADGG